MGVYVCVCMCVCVCTCGSVLPHTRALWACRNRSCWCQTVMETGEPLDHSTDVADADLNRPIHTAGADTVHTHRTHMNTHSYRCWRTSHTLVTSNLSVNIVSVIEKNQSDVTTLMTAPFDTLCIYHRYSFLTINYLMLMSGV